MTLYSAFTVLLSADKTLAARIGSTCGQPKVLTENPNTGQIEREKMGSTEKKAKGVQAPEIQKQFAYHAGQFHD
jgi:hypothetical protein